MRTPARPAELADGRTFGRYRILRTLGRGGMGTVYLAHDTRLQRDVALKVPQLTPDDGPDIAQRFTREARALAQLDHPNICPVHDVGEIGGIPFLTMAYVEGRSLSALVDGPPLPQRRAAEIVRTLALALAEAHARGIIHRDLKPSNVLVSPRRELVLIDFGLARRVEAGDARLTRAGMILGTPAYMAPEQISGDVGAVGPGCDIYSLGVLLYELLTGRPPFEGPASVVLGLVMVVEAPPPSEFRTGLDPRLELICRRAMAKKVPDRYPSMAALAEALDEALRGPPRLEESPRAPSAAGSHPTTRIGHAEIVLDGPFEPKPAPAGKPRRRLPNWLLWVAAACLALIGLVALVTRFATGTGTVRIDVPGPAAVVHVDGIPIRPDRLGTPLTLPVGEHHLLVTRGDRVVEALTFRVRRGDQLVLKIGPPPRPIGEARAEPGPAPGPPILETAPAPLGPASPAMPGDQDEPLIVVPPAGERTNSIGMTMVLISAGEFVMGSPETDPDAKDYEKPAHRVRINTRFQLSKYEVTQDQYQLVMGQNPSSSYTRHGGRLPVDTVGWLDAVAFCNRLSEKEGLAPYYSIAGQEVSIQGGFGYRLPSEAEWEYACRAGSTTRFSFADDSARLGEYAWYDGNSQGEPLWVTHLVGQKKPNAWGLHDMHGNVLEWCWDHLDFTPYSRVQTPDPIGPEQGTLHVVRGGCFGLPSAFHRSAWRAGGSLEVRGVDNGFRPARTSE